MTDTARGLPAELFHRSNALYEEGDRILPGNWGRLVMGIGAGHSLFYREYLWEMVRQREQADLPSRLSVAYAFEDQIVAEGFVQQANLPAPFTYLVGPSAADSRTARADMRWWDDGLLNTLHRFEHVESCAKNYWNGQSTAGRPEWEWLIEGALTVIRRISPLSIFDDHGLTALIKASSKQSANTNAESGGATSRRVRK